MIELMVFLAIARGSVTSANALRREKLLFEEFLVSTRGILLVYLFPVSPITFLMISAVTGNLPIACLISVALLVPGVLVIRKAAAKFQRSGTSRTKEVEDALSVAFISGIGGIAYAGGATALQLLLNVSAPVG